MSRHYFTETANHLLFKLHLSVSLTSSTILFHCLSLFHPHCEPGEKWGVAFKNKLLVPSMPGGDPSLISVRRSKLWIAAINQNASEIRLVSINCHFGTWWHRFGRKLLLTATRCLCLSLCTAAEGIRGPRHDVEWSEYCDRSGSHEVAVVFDNSSRRSHPQGYKTVLDAYRCTWSSLIWCLC